MFAGLLGGLLLATRYGMMQRRALPDEVAEKLTAIPTVQPNQHLVDLVLRDGRVVRGVYIGYGRFPRLTPRRLLHPYDVKSVIDVREHVSEQPSS